MDQQTNQSQVARLLAQIDTEYTAAQRALTGFAESAKHAAINARMENIGRIHTRLHSLVGDVAGKLVAERLEMLPE